MMMIEVNYKITGYGITEATCRPSSALILQLVGSETTNSRPSPFEFEIKRHRNDEVELLLLSPIGQPYSIIRG